MNQTKQGKINLFHLLLMALIGAMLIAILFPVHLHCGAVAPITRTVSSAKQITLGLIMYASDYDDLPPFVHPFEFGIDPLDPYIKNSDDHDIPDPPHEGKRKPGTSDFRFQYVLQKQSCGGYVSTRLILGPFSKLTEPTMTIVMTGNVNDKEGKEIIVTSFADGYVK